MTAACCACLGQEFLGRINSKAVVVMVVVDTKPVILPNLHNGHMDGVKRQLRKVAAATLTSSSFDHP